MRRALVAGVLGALATATLACESSKSASQAARPTPATPPPSSPERAPHPPATTPIATAPPPRSAGEVEGIEYLVNVTGRAAPNAELPLVVAVHGLGDRPERFRLFQNLDQPLRVVRPRGPTSHGPGFSWFDVKVRDVNREETVVSLRQSAARLASFLRALPRHFPTKGKPILTGFSQGGMLSFTVAAHHPEVIAAAFPLAGWLPPPLVPAKAPKTTAPIVALHGEADPILPLAPTQRSVADLRSAGFEAQLLTYPDVPHSLTPAMLRELHRRVVTTAAGLP